MRLLKLAFRRHTNDISISARLRKKPGGRKRDFLVTKNTDELLTGLEEKGTHQSEFLRDGGQQSSPEVQVESIGVVIKNPRKLNTRYKPI